MKTGLALLHDELTSNSYDVRLKLTKELLIIQKQDVVCVSGGDSHLNVSTESLPSIRSRFRHDSDTNFSCAHHSEHKVPVVISKIFKDQVGKMTSVPPIRCKAKHSAKYVIICCIPSGSPGPSSDQSSRASSPLFDSGLHLNGNSNNTVSHLLYRCDLPLFMARISRNKAETDKLRSNSFEVIALDGVCTHVLQFCTATESTDWLQAISTNINDLTQESMGFLCWMFSPQIVHMGWVCEHLQGGDVELVHSCRFLALRGSSLLVFRSPPVSSYWVQAEASFHLCEVLFKVHKLWIAEDCWIQSRFYLGLQQDGELRDSEPFCFSVLVGHGQSFCYSVELGSELVLWEKAFQRAVFMEVQRVRSKSYMCSSQGKILCFTLDFESGFSCSDSISKKTIWKYKFSQLKGSSDDGKTRVKLLFQNSENKQIEMKELEFANLTAVLHCIHSFIAAKVATVDPVFVNNQSLTQKYM
uniref:Syntrophin, gamma 2 n=1 Tax=Cyprinus carpio TaxID=7962 RepID=A0A8C2BV85_CYPCA